MKGGLPSRGSVYVAHGMTSDDERLVCKAAKAAVLKTVHRLWQRWPAPTMLRSAGLANVVGFQDAESAPRSPTTPLLCMLAAGRSCHSLSLGGAGLFMLPCRVLWVVFGEQVQASYMREGCMSVCMSALLFLSCMCAGGRPSGPAAAEGRPHHTT